MERISCSSCRVCALSPTMACVTRKNRNTQSVNFSATNFAWRHQLGEGNELPLKRLIGTSVPRQGMLLRNSNPNSLVQAPQNAQKTGKITKNWQIPAWHAYCLCFCDETFAANGSPVQSLDLTNCSGGARCVQQPFNKLLSSKAQDFPGSTD